MKKTCVVDGCSRPIHGRGMCNAHYSRWRRNAGELLEARRPPVYMIDDDLARQMFASGSTAADVAKRFDVSLRTADRAKKRLGFAQQRLRDLSPLDERLAVAAELIEQRYPMSEICRIARLRDETVVRHFGYRWTKEEVREFSSMNLKLTRLLGRVPRHTNRREKAA
ncbi:hypothetical protein [Agromyces larvae]|uniref:Uncharacterized protein n=1 Tax=Agromyces larvae TaxID=2929802 RepID=A0ABY4C375_9MICO|nr:hypothetical protein [Agromyces larvae]UOE45927.1 hypothetical protein MTO99_09360 [Agromyces larvae]